VPGKFSGFGAFSSGVFGCFFAGVLLPPTFWQALATFQVPSPPLSPGFFFAISSVFVARGDTPGSPTVLRNCFFLSPGISRATTTVPPRSHCLPRPISPTYTRLVFYLFPCVSCRPHTPHGNTHLSCLFLRTSSPSLPFYHGMLLLFFFCRFLPTRFALQRSHLPPALKPPFSLFSARSPSVPFK